MDESTKNKSNEVIVIMGVSGSGKSTIAKQLAKSNGLAYYDADDFHPVSNIKKMQMGISLTDEDRQPWLETLASQISRWKELGGAVLACSALKESYRKTIQMTSDCSWIYLQISESLVRERFKKRKDHFMPSELIHSQFITLEEPAYGMYIDARKPVNEIIEEITATLK